MTLHEEEERNIMLGNKYNRVFDQMVKQAKNNLIEQDRMSPHGL